jgi:LPS-assembly lipoprotein
MSLAKTNRDFARQPLSARAGLAILGLAALLGGCADGTGFQPLYGTAALGGANVSEKLAAVDVAPVPGRVGQRLRNEFIYQSTGGGEPLPPKYRLEIAVRESVSSTLVRIDGDARGQIYNLDANFKLIRMTDQAVVMEGRSYGRAGFERVNSVFANVRAREDAENRAAKTVGDELRTRVLAYLAQPA